MAASRPGSRLRRRTPPAESTATETAPTPQRTRRRLRLWWLPLTVAIVLPLLLWLGANAAFYAFAVNDLPAPQPTVYVAAPDQPLLDAATTLVRQTSCAPAGGQLQAQAPYTRANWEARRSISNSRTYFVAASDRQTSHLLGIWQVEGGTVSRLLDATCTGLPAGTNQRLAEAASLFATVQSGG